MVPPIQILVMVEAVAHLIVHVLAKQQQNLQNDTCAQITFSLCALWLVKETLHPCVPSRLISVLSRFWEATCTFTFGKK